MPEDDDNLTARRLDYLKRHGYMSDHLAVFVEDQKHQAANLINNNGMEAQLDYLMKTLSWSELLAALQEHRQLLIDHAKKINKREGKN